MVTNVAVGMQSFTVPVPLPQQTPEAICSAVGLTINDMYLDLPRPAANPASPPNPPGPKPAAVKPARQPLITSHAPTRQNSEFLSPPLPANPEAERAVLGSILLDQNSPKTFIHTVQMLDVTDFHTSLHQRIFGAMKRLAMAEIAIDSVTLFSEMQKTGDLSDSEEIAAFSTIADGLPRVTNIEHYCGIVKECANLRKLIYFGEQIQKQAFERSDCAQILTKAHEQLAAFGVTNTGATALKPYTPDQLAALVSAPVDFIAYPAAARGMVTVLDGEAKAAGKTTFLLHGIQSCRKQQIFLNRATQRVNVLLVSEENPRTLNLAIARSGLVGEDQETKETMSGVYILPRKDWAGPPWPVLVGRIERICRELKIGWLILDTFFAIAGLGGDKENNAGDVDAAIAPVRDLAGKLDIAVTLTRHERKSGGDVGQSGRGSSALTGACDIILQIRRIGSNFRPAMRQLEITGRIEPERLTIELSSGRYISHEQADVRISTSEQVDAITRVIQQNPRLTSRELEKATGVDKNRVAKLARRAGWENPPGKGKEWIRDATKQAQ